MIVTYDDDGKITGSIVASVENIDTTGMKYIVVDGTANLNDKKVVNGELVNKSDSVIEAEQKAKTILEIKNTRLQLLYGCDWTQNTDAPLTDSKKTEWISYRQKLRDLPKDQKDKTKFSDITWPSKPS